MLGLARLIEGQTGHVVAPSGCRAMEERARWGFYFLGASTVNKAPLAVW